MAYWDNENQEIVRSPPKQAKHYPGWLEIDCGCCTGVQWGGEYPMECSRCGGSGAVFQHIKSKVIAQYPGGPFC